MIPPLGRQIRQGVAASGTSYAFRQLLEIGTAIALARLLTPGDFGIVAVGMSFLMLSQIVGNLGMGVAVIQLDAIDEQDVNAAFTISTLVALCLTACGVLIAPAASTYFRVPDLAVAMPGMAVQVLLSGVAAIPVALLRRRLLLTTVAKIEAVAGLAAAATGIAMALTGFGFWSLVWGPVVGAAVTLAVSLRASRYRPRFTLRSRQITTISRFGRGLTLKNLFVFLSRNIDNLVIARLLGPVPIGIYSRAYNLTRIPQARILGIVYQVTFPAFCRLRHDKRRFYSTFDTASRLIALSVTPILLGLAAVARDFTIAVLGPQWAGMETPLAILALAALVNCGHALAGAAIEATGRIQYEVLTQGTYAALITVGAIVGANWGIVGVSMAVLCASLIFFAFKATTIFWAVGIQPVDFVRPLVRPLIAGGVMYFLVTLAIGLGEESLALLASHNHAARLAVGIAVGTVVYVAAIRLIAPEHLQLLLTQLGKLRREAGTPHGDQSGPSALQESR